MEEIAVLLVEDEPVLAAIVKESLEKRGFRIQIAKNGIEGWDLFKTTRPDICVIDVMLPRKDGFSLLTDIRLIDDQVPVICLTARTGQDDVLKGLELGADDYMKKPFSMEELILRLKAMTRRKPGKSASSSSPGLDFLVGKFRYNQDRLELSGDPLPVILSQREGDLLYLLLLNKNQLLERREALVKLWGNDNPLNARSMDVYITRLRKFIKSDPSVAIINHRGQGYSLVEYTSRNN
ncbi:MAG TPA: response regulator transcription factor [Puia sp.]|jgi:DNA-binding response OmpR family regulator